MAEQNRVVRLTLTGVLLAVWPYLFSIAPSCPPLVLTGPASGSPDGINGRSAGEVNAASSWAMLRRLAPKQESPVRWRDNGFERPSAGMAELEVSPGGADLSFVSGG
jgi:hypothetical protein